MPLFSGPTVGHVWVKVHGDGTGLDDDIEDSIDDSQPVWKKGGEESGESFNEGWLKAFREGMADREKEWANQNRGFRSQMTKNTKAVLTDVKVLEHFITKSTDVVQNAWNDLYDAEVEYARGLDYLIIQERKHQIEVQKKTADFSKMRKELAEARQDQVDWSDAFGRAFGRGSRNNFLNFVGSFVGGLANMGEELLKFAAGSSEAGIKFGELIYEMGKSGGTLQKVGAGIARFAGRGGAGAGAGVGIAALPVLLGLAYHGITMFASGISGLIGIVAAIVSSITYGLIGALGGLIGVLGTAAFGVGVLALAIANLDKDTKKALKPVGEEFKALGETAADAFGPHLVKNVDGFVDVLKGARPVVRATADAMGRVLDKFMKDLKQPEWQAFKRDMTQFLPNAVEDLGNSGANLSKGLGGVFRALIPLTEEFLGWLTGITDEFAEWATSAEGQRKMKKFFDEAGESAAILGDFLWSVGEALGVIVSEGKDTGDGMLKGITDALDRFVKWAGTDEGKKAFDDFFKFAEDLGGELGDLVEKVIELWDKLDTPRSRKNLLAVLNIVEDILDKFIWLAERVERFIELAEKAKAVVGELWERASNKAEGFVEKLADVKSGITKAFSNLGETRGKITSAFAGLAGKILGKIGDISLFKNFEFPSLDKIASKFGGAAAKILNKISTIDLWKNLSFPSLDKIAAKFIGAAGKIGNKIGDVNLIDNFDFPSLETIAGKFAGLGAKISSQIGTVTIDIVANLTGGLAGKGWDWINAHTASGGIFEGAQMRIIGEAGPEAVVPLNRPLSRVDPAVRELSAIAQGLQTPHMANGGVVAEARPIDITVVTPTKDPYAVAVETVNRLTAVGYS